MLSLPWFSIVSMHKNQHGNIKTQRQAGPMSQGLRHPALVRCTS